MRGNPFILVAMKRRPSAVWTRGALLAFCALLAATGCDVKDQGAGPGRSATVQARAPDLTPIEERVAAGLANQASPIAAGAGADEPSTGMAELDHLFDNQAIRDRVDQAGEDSAASSSDAVPVAPGPRAPRRLRLRRGPKPSRDLDLPAPPSVDPASARPGSRDAGGVLAAFSRFEQDMRAAGLFAAVYPVLSRAGWRALAPKTARTPMVPTHLTIHHTEGRQTMTAAQTAAEAREIQRYHMHGRAREGKDVWSDIGYHFLIAGDGEVVEGRPTETLGAHARGANAHNIGIAMMGDFQKIRPTPAQLDSLIRLAAFLAVKYRGDTSRESFLEPHRHYDRTDCPGENLVALLGYLRVHVRDRAGRIAAAAPGRFIPLVVTGA